MPETKISNIDFTSLFEQERILNVISPEILSGTLNAALQIKPESTTIQLVLKDSTSYMEVSVSADIDSPSTIEKGILIEYQKLLYIFHNYSKEELAALVLTLEEKPDGASSFLLTTGRDKIALPHKILDSSLADDFINRHDQLVASSQLTGLDWPAIPDKKDFLLSLSQGLRFVSSDETKNNAIAVYPDKLIVNDRRHVFVKRFAVGLVGITSMVPIHKKIARILTTAAQFDDKMTFVLGSQNNIFYFKTRNLEGRFNNAISNVAPPSEADLERLTPKANAFNVSTSDLLQTSTFFSGLYSSTTTTSEWNPITWVATGGEKTFKIMLKDSGSIGYNSCSVERELNVNGSVSDMDVTLINDSLRAFLSLIEVTDKEVSIQTPSNSEPAVKLSAGNVDMFMAKLL